jgi:transposase
MEAISVDLRARICLACDDGLETRQEVADRYGVSRSFVQKVLRWRTDHGGSIAPLPHTGGRASLMKEPDRRLLRQIVAGRRDATLAELCAELAKQKGPTLSVPTMCRELKALRLPLKKRRCMPVRGRRRASAPCEGTGRSGWPRSLRRSGSSWTNRGSTPR